VKWLASVAKPAAPIGDPISISTGAALGSFGRRSYVSLAPGTSIVRVIGSAVVVVVTMGSLHVMDSSS
jgi:hypothetical protein